MTNRSRSTTAGFYMKGAVMPFARARVVLLPARDDFRIASDALQSAIGKFRRYLRICGVEVSTPMFYQATDAAAGGYVGEFIVPLPHAIRPPLAMIVSAWLQERAGRRVLLRVGDGEAVARSAEQAAIFLWRAHRLREAPSASDEEASS
jgi:hypothetical protein